MSEVSDAVQIIAMTGRGAMVLGSLSIKAVLLVEKIMNTVYLSKWKGATSLNRFRNIKGDDMLFINVSTEDEGKLNYIEKELESHCILFARLPDMKYMDGRTQYVIASSDIAKFNVCLLDHSAGLANDIKMGVVSPEDYARTAFEEDGTPTKEYQDMERSAKEQLINNRIEAAPEPMRIAMQDYDQRIFHKMLPGNLKRSKYEYVYEQYWDREASEALRVHENNVIYGTTITWMEMEPIEEDEKGRWGAYRLPDGGCCVIPREDMYDGKISIRDSKEYLVVGQDGRTVGTVKGRELAASFLEYKRPGKSTPEFGIALGEPSVTQNLGNALTAGRSR